MLKMATDSGFWRILDFSGRKAFAAFLTCAAVSYGHEIKLLALGDIPKWAAQIANVGAIFFGAITLISVLLFVTKPIRSLLNRRNLVKYIDSQMASMTREEFEIIGGMVLSNQRSQSGDLMDPVMAALRQKGLIQFAGGTGRVDRWAFSIPNEVWRVLKANEDQIRTAWDRSGFRL